MRLLLDQNISFRVVHSLAADYAGSLHVRDVGLTAAEDDAVWNYAVANNLIIVSKDSDFHDRSLLRGAPPQVIWLRVGNCSTDRIIELLNDNVEAIREFAASGEESFLALS